MRKKGFRKQPKKDKFSEVELAGGRTGPGVREGIVSVAVLFRRFLINDGYF